MCEGLPPSPSRAVSNFPFIFPATFPLFCQFFFFFFAYENAICTILISRIANFGSSIRYLIWTRRRRGTWARTARVWQCCRVCNERPICANIFDACGKQTNRQTVASSRICFCKKMEFLIHFNWQHRQQSGSKRNGANCFAYWRQQCQCSEIATSCRILINKLANSGYIYIFIYIYTLSMILRSVERHSRDTES